MNPIPVDKDSESEILKASAILLFNVRKVAFSPWTENASEGVLIRKADMTCAIREVLKGEIMQKPEESFQLIVTQKKPIGDIYLTDYGNWSKAEISAGKRFLVFCDLLLKDARLLLEEGNFEQLLDPDVYLKEVHAALTLESRGSKPEELLTVAADNASKTHEVFPHYVWAKSKSEIRRKPALFESYCKIIEGKETSESSRITYFTSLYEDLGLSHGQSLPLEKRFLLAQFRLLVQKKKEDLGLNLAKVYIPNSLGLGRGTPIVSATELFKDNANLRKESETSLKELTGAPATKLLQDWISQP